MDSIKRQARRAGLLYFLPSGDGVAVQGRF